MIFLPCENGRSKPMWVSKGRSQPRDDQYGKGNLDSQKGDLHLGPSTAVARNAPCQVITSGGLQNLKHVLLATFCNRFRCQHLELDNLWHFYSASTLLEQPASLGVLAWRPTNQAVWSFWNGTPCMLPALTIIMATSSTFGYFWSLYLVKKTRLPMNPWSQISVSGRRLEVSWCKHASMRTLSTQHIWRLQ